MEREEALEFSRKLSTLQKIRLIRVLEEILRTQEDYPAPEEKVEELLRSVS